MKNLLLSLGLISAFALAACGGRDEENPPPDQGQAPAAMAPAPSSPPTTPPPADPAQPATTEQPEAAELPGEQPKR
ncbi:MAG: hypothetical protein ACRES8_00940 [Nevskiaceae bacterium]